MRNSSVTLPGWDGPVIPQTRSLVGAEHFRFGTLLTLVAGADAEATAENGPLADSSSEAVVNNPSAVQVRCDRTQ